MARGSWCPVLASCRMGAVATGALFARLSASRGAQPIGAFAGGGLPTTILSCCAGALLPLLSSAAVLPLRAACREAGPQSPRTPGRTARL